MRLLNFSNYLILRWTSAVCYRNSLNFLDNEIQKQTQRKQNYVENEDEASISVRARFEAIDREKCLDIALK
jgi:hypothetical protein